MSQRPALNPHLTNTQIQTPALSCQSGCKPHDKTYPQTQV